MKTLLATIALGATVISTQAGAQIPGTGRPDMTRQQAQQMADRMFQRMDLNHDGVVTRAEAEQAAQQFGGGKRIERRIDSAFGTAQSLTLQQFEAESLAQFDRDDLNHDGVVTAAEREQARAAMKAERTAQPPQAPPPPPGQ